MKTATTMVQEVKIETVKGSIALGGAAAAGITLNQWVAIATLAYIIIQAVILLHKHYWNIKDRRKSNDSYPCD